jgi:hypothetical protein
MRISFFSRLESVKKCSNANLVDDRCATVLEPIAYPMQSLQVELLLGLDTDISMSRADEL